MKEPNELYGRPWIPREFHIVLHSYFEHRFASHDASSAHVRMLERLIGRTPAAIAMRLQNFASIDPEVKERRKGLENIGLLGKEVFSKWLKDPLVMKKCAEVYIEEAKALEQEATLFNPKPTSIAKAFGKYDTLDFIGQGSFGAVCSCINAEDEKLYALKIIRPDIPPDGEILARFRREIRALKAIMHPNVIRIYEYDLGEGEQPPHFIMDLALRSLTDYLNQKWTILSRGDGPSSQLWQEAWTILEAILSAADALHRNNPALVHRDINPQNILQLPGGTWVLADLGLVKLPSQTYVTSCNKSLGTETYTPVEQRHDFASADERADVFSLGVLTWELFTSEGPPFDRTYLVGLPEPLRHVVLRATERDRNKRYASMSELSKDLHKAKGLIRK